jgi:hypothetical protein
LGLKTKDLKIEQDIILLYFFALCRPPLLSLPRLFPGHIVVDCFEGDFNANGHQLQYIIFFGQDPQQPFFLAGLSVML